jgi:aspartokinase-like uncharacterized kinase
MNPPAEAEPPVAIKVGGSLFGWPEFPARLAHWLDEERPSRPVLIAGGGPPADFVRTLDASYGLGDETAHRLALRAMDFTAEALAALLPGSRVVRRLDQLASAWGEGRRPIFAPRLYLEDVDERRPDRLPFSWEVTSDAIAARVAVDLRASRLVLLKSASAAAVSTLAEAASAGLVDPYFPAVAEGLDRVEIVDLRDPNASRRVLVR